MGLISWLGQVLRLPERVKSWIRLAKKADQLIERGQYQQAIIVVEEVLELAHYLWGPKHENVATSLNNLAFLYKAQGRYAEAEPLYLQALKLSQEVLEDKHPDVASSLDNLAGLYRAQGRYAEAEPLYLQALELRQEVLGDEHPDVATSFIW